MSHMSAGVFWATFTDPADRVGQDITEGESTSFYRVMREGKELVGATRHDRRTSQTVHSLLTGETADMVVYWYTVRPLSEARAEVCLLVDTSRAYLQRCVKLGSRNSSLIDALRCLERCWRELRLGQELVRVEREARAEGADRASAGDVAGSSSGGEASSAAVAVRDQVRGTVGSRHD